MKRPFISSARPLRRSRERGVTLALVALAMVAIIGMAALSIDIVALYLAREEAQRSADAAALAAARILSLSGMTGDSTGASGSWPLACAAATQAAQAVAQQNGVNGLSVPTAQITVTYPNNPGCAQAPVFGVNPQVTVKVTRQNLPAFFARIWGSKSNQVSATATAEAYNPSNSLIYAGNSVPVQPRCVKPWIVPNRDPVNAGNTFVSTATGGITTPGILQLGAGVIGEQLILTSACTPGAPNCNVFPGPSNMLAGHNPPTSAPPNFLDYVPALTQPNPYTAVPNSCSNADDFQMAIDGCDQSTQYACGTISGAQVNLNVAPVSPTAVTGDTSTAVQCLTNQSAFGNDSLLTMSGGSPVFPFQIEAGLGNPLVQNGIVNASQVITTSSSIVSLPIYDNSSGAPFTTNQPTVNIVGFLQVFITNVDGAGNVWATVLNVAGCGTAAATAVNGSSPVPIRLITP